jgi:hypothetical protein
MSGTKRNQIIPYATRYLIINCYRPDNALFKGLYRVSRMFMKLRYCRCLNYTNETTIDLRKRRNLGTVLISGHGGRDGARMTDGADTRLYPWNLLLPPNTRLFLLGCHQGMPARITEWAGGTGVDPANIHGAAGETETALSTLCLLGVLEDGIATLEKWFTRWIEANEYFRPWFALMRETYRAQGRVFASAIAEIGRLIDLGPFGDMLSAGMKHPEYLDNMG